MVPFLSREIKSDFESSGIKSYLRLFLIFALIASHLVIVIIFLFTPILQFILYNQPFSIQFRSLLIINLPIIIGLFILLSLRSLNPHLFDKILIGKQNAKIIIVVSVLAQLTGLNYFIYLLIHQNAIPIGIINELIPTFTLAFMLFNSLLLLIAFGLSIIDKDNIQKKTFSWEIIDLEVGDDILNGLSDKFNILELSHIFPTIANSSDDKKSNAHIFYLKGHKTLRFVLTIENFDSQNRIEDQIKPIQEKVSNLFHSLDKAYFQKIHILKTSILYNNDKQYLDGDKISANHKGLLDQIHLVFDVSEEFLKARSENYNETQSINKTAIEFLNITAQVSKVLKVKPVLIGNLVQSFLNTYLNSDLELKSKEHSKFFPMSELLLDLKLLDQWMIANLKDSGLKKQEPALIKKIFDHSFNSLPFEFNAKSSLNNAFLKQLIKDINLSTLLKISFQTIKNDDYSLTIDYSIKIKGDIYQLANQFLETNVLVFSEGTETNGKFINATFKNSSSDTVMISLLKEYKDQSNYRNTLRTSFQRIKQLFIKFSFAGIDQREYSKDFQQKAKQIYFEDARPIVFNLTTLKKLKKDNLPQRPKQKVRLVIDSSYLSVDYPGLFPAKIINNYQHHLQLLSLFYGHLQKNEQESNLNFLIGRGGFLTAKSILDILLVFTQDEVIENFSPGAIEIGVDVETQLPIVANMLEYQEKQNNAKVTNTNGHAVIIGKSGSGKSFFAKSLIYQKFKNNRLFIFDIEKEYDHLVSILGFEPSLDQNSNLQIELKKYLDEAKQRTVHQNDNKVKIENFDLLDLNKKINMFQIFFEKQDLEKIQNAGLSITDLLTGVFQLKMKTESEDNKPTSNLTDTSLITKISKEYLDHRDFLLKLLKDFFSITTASEDIYLLNLIHQTYLEFYKTFSKKSTDNFNPSNPSHFPTFFDFYTYLKEYNELDKKDKEKFQAQFRLDVGFATNFNQFFYELHEKAKRLIGNSQWVEKFGKASENIDLNQADVIHFDLTGLLNVNGVVRFAKWSLSLLLNYIYNSTFKKGILAKEQENAQHSNDRNGVLIVIDEAHRYLNKDLMDMVDFMGNISKRGRKRGVDMVIISQQIADFYRESDSRDLMQSARDTIKNANYKFLFQIGGEFNEALDFIESGFKITEADQNFLKQITRGLTYFVQGPLSMTKVKVELPKSLEEIRKAYKAINKADIF